MSFYKIEGHDVRSYKGENDMNRIFKGITLSLAVLATVVTSSIPASADDFYRHHRNNNGDALAAGAIGLIAGTLIGGAMVQQSRPRRVYIDPPVKSISSASLRQSVLW